MFKAALPVVFLLSTFGLFGSTVGTMPCVSGSLSVYESSYAPPSGGCAIGILDYSNFSYAALQNAPATTDILVTPGTTTNGFSFSQVGGLPFIASGDVVQFAIYYTIVIDPAPVIPGASNHLDPPIGNVNITEDICNDSLLRGSATTYNCQAPASPIYALTVTTAAPNASVIFRPPASDYQTVAIIFTLDGTHGVASFDGLDTDTQVNAAPEPASTMLVGLFMLVGGYKLKKRKN